MSKFDKRIPKESVLNGQSKFAANDPVGTEIPTDLH